MLNCADCRKEMVDVAAALLHDIPREPIFTVYNSARTVWRLVCEDCYIEINNSKKGGFKNE